MNYDLVYTRRSIKDISGLDAGIRNRIGKTLLRYKEDPLKYAENYQILKLALFDLE